ncbi:MAG: hypothetical protein QOE08_950 [Thermoleophilaceae bacterium]|jgi:steroid delta-isomerase-like uncharacterized protein|nr:hypothetical protein [Thermoleophilaceae bacterium]
MTGAGLDRASALSRLGELWREAWADPSVDSFSRCCAASVNYEDPLSGEPLEGLDALARHAQRVRAALPDMRLEPVAESIVEGGYGCLPWRLAGTHRGDMGNVPATGRFLVLHGVHYVELADGRVKRARGFFDLYDVATQLGLLPSRGSLSEQALMMLRGFGLRR